MFKTQINKKNTLVESLLLSWKMIKVYVPLAVLTVILKQIGFIDFISPFFSPVMRSMGLPGETAVTLIAAGVNSIYGGIATMAAFDLTFRQITILGIVLGISHNLIIETGILIKLKFATAWIALFRFICGIVTGILMNMILPEHIDGVILISQHLSTEFSWIQIMKNILFTCLQILVIILVMNYSYRLVKAIKGIGNAKEKMKFIPAFFGISNNAFVPWVIGVVFGIMYGAGLLFQFAEKNEISHKDASLITVFLCIAHAVIEDTLLFVVLGGSLWWILFVRMALAILIIKILMIHNAYLKVQWIGLVKFKK